MSEITSKNTSINKSRPPAIIKLVEKLGGFKRGQKVFDYGCGKYPEVTVKALKRHRVVYAGFDPHNRTPRENAEANKIIPRQTADTVLCSNVLNVVRTMGDRRVLLVLALNRLKMGGTFYATVYEGDKSGKGRKTQEDCWQCNKKTEAYMKEIIQVFGNCQRKGKLLIAVKGKKPKKTV